MDKTQFLRTYLPYARSVSEQTGIAPEVVLAQTALETGWGKSAPSGNFFGIKGSGQTLPTQEFRNGQMVTENAGFRSYASPADSFTDYAKLMMNNKRYAPVLGAQGADAQIEALGKSGYATDPNYAAKLSQIKNSINLNSPDLIGSDTMRALGVSPGAIGPMTGSNQPQRTGAPMGLLDTQPAQQPEQKKSGFWDNFAGGLLADPDRRAKIGIALEGMTLNPNQGLIKNLQSGIDTRKEQGISNRTIEWLSKQPNGAAYVEMIKAGNSPASVVQAYQSATTQKPRSGVEVGGKLVDPTTGNVIYDPTGGATNALSPDQLTSLNSVRDDLRTELKSFEIVKSGYNNISTFYSNPSATSDYALAVAFAKILDPGSVAREGEVAAVQNAGAKVPALGQALKNALTGEGSLTPEVRQQIAELSTQIYQERLTEANQIISQYGDIAKRAGLPTDVLYSGTIPQPMQIVPAVVPAAAAAQGVTQEMWDQASQDEKKHWLE